MITAGIAATRPMAGASRASAIPAVVFYNKFNHETEQVINGYEGFADEFSMILSRQLDRAA